ncbi:hypothetical protein MMC13_001933 [Lambiella insularis]|nr:hypothetical protein [Lambiella insularis]
MFAPLNLTRSRSSTHPPPPTTLLPFFSGSLKSSLSPPATTTSSTATDYFSFSPSLAFSPSSPGNTSTAYPSWPNRASLSVSVGDCASNPNASIYSPTRRSTPGYGYEGEYTCPNSYISDEDLLDLEGWGLSCADEEGVDAAGEDGEGLGISWSATRQPDVVVGEERRRRSRPGPVLQPARKRERSRSVKRRVVGRVMSTIAE